jgi:colanic acid biosynthesis glycosyl transferase WcaI
MEHAGKVIIVSQYYAPDPSTTAAYMTAIAETLAREMPVVVLSGTPTSVASSGAQDRPSIVPIPGWQPRKDALARRAVAMALFAMRTFFSTLLRARRGDVVFCVTSPFTLPYAVMVAARMRGAAAVLLIYDLYPEALEMAGLIRPGSIVGRLIRFANKAMFRALSAIIVIGRDVRNLLLAYQDVVSQKIIFIPNWPLIPTGFREPGVDNAFRRGHQSQLVVGLSGNLGFTHSPGTVFQAAELLNGDPDIHLILSGWGVGWNELKDLQAAKRLDNVTLLDPVAESELEEFLAAADVWIIPYRRNVAGVSVPSRLYNLLAIGRAVIVAAEPYSEASMVVNENEIGWVVPPEAPDRLADAIRQASSDRAATLQKGRRAAAVATHYAAASALSQYSALMHRLRVPVSGRSR